ncbi:MAG: hypothetical protein PVF20_01675 [Desulfobacterales bacterium]|jgi:hypothetical protein
MSLGPVKAPADQDRADLGATGVAAGRNPTENDSFDLTDDKSKINDKILTLLGIPMEKWVSTLLGMV